MAVTTEALPAPLVKDRAAEMCRLGEILDQIGIRRLEEALMLLQLAEKNDYGFKDVASAIERRKRGNAASMKYYTEHRESENARLAKRARLLREKEKERETAAADQEQNSS